MGHLMRYETRVNPNNGNTFVRTMVGKKKGKAVRASRTFPKGTPKEEINNWVRLSRELGFDAWRDREMTFDAFMGVWLKHKKPQLAERTYNAYSRDVERYFEGKFGLLKDVTPDDLQDFIDAHSHLSPASLRRFRAYFKMMFDYAVLKEYIQKNPVNKAVVVPKMRRIRKIRVLSVTQFEQLSEALEDESEIKLALRTLLLTGLRVSELLALQPEHVMTDTLRVEQSLVSRYGDRVVTPPKTNNSFRTISIPESLAADLRGLGGGEFLFTPRYTCLRSNLGKTCDRLQLPKLSIHGLRHSHCVYLLAKGVHVLAVSRRLGHYSPAFTLEKYGHLVPSMNDKITEVLGE